MNCLSLNAQGLGSKAKKDWIRELITKHKVSFLSIQETKMELISAMDVKQLWGNYIFDHSFSEALGNSGGILCTWDSSIFHKEHHIISDNFVALYGTWIPNQLKLLVISVYAPQSLSSKQMLWSYISSLIVRWNGECLVMGDFNEVRCKEERWGSTFNAHGANVFNTFISSSGLIDVQLEGYAFTWAHPSASKMSKLDQFLVSDGLISSFPYISAICLDRHLSDHRPILLRECISDFGAIPFRFYHSWFGLPGFDQMVIDLWNSLVLDDNNGMIRFKKKLQLLKKKIRGRVMDYKRQQVGRVNDLKAKLSVIDKELDQGRVSSDDLLLSRMESMKLLHDFQSSINRDNIQKAKIRVMVDGEWMDDPSRVKEEFHNHFATRFQDPGANRDEIRLAVWGCGEDKSPGPDGFTFEFFRKFWKVVGPDFCIAVEWFFEHGSFAIGCNSSFVALIPKILDPKIVSDYRPISLIGSLYKVITKILATRLSSVISSSYFLKFSLAFPSPTGVPRLVIFSLVSSLSWCKFKYNQAMVFKVDFAKAYDSIRWDYLDDVLNSFGFGSKWRSWIRGSLISGKASILVNGSPTSEFQFHRGLKQGDPLAPFLFILIMESLHLSFSRAVEAGIFTGIEIGLSINVKKSQLLGIGISDSIVSEAAKSLGCSIMKTPFKYLGIPVGGNMSLIKAWDESIVKLKRRLSKWKLKTLSIGGRLTLLKSVLGSTPIYNMSLFKVPKSVLHSKGELHWQGWFKQLRLGAKSKEVLEGLRLTGSPNSVNIPNISRSIIPVDSRSSNISVTTSISECSSNPNDVSSATVNDRPRIWIPAVEASLKPSKGHVFTSLTQAYDFYKHYGKIGGFDIKLGTEKNYHGTEVPDIKYFNCTKGGKKGESKYDNHKFDVFSVCNIDKGKGIAVASSVCSAANGKGKGKVTGDGFSRKGKTIDVSNVSKPDDGFSRKGPVRAFKLMKEMYGRFENVGATATDCKNFRRDLNLFIGDRDAQMVVEKLENLKKRCDGFLWIIAKAREIHYVFVLVRQSGKIELPAVGSFVCNKSNFKERFCRIVWNERISIDMFEQEWVSIMDKFDLGSHKWLCDLYGMRHRWIPTFLRDKDMSGLMRTTSRSESENRYFNRFTNPDLTLVEFIGYFESAIDIQRYTQKKNDHESRYNHEIVASIAKCLSVNVEQMGGSEKYFIRDTDVKKRKDSTQFEVYKVFYCSSNTVLTCSCRRYELYGLLCRHILYVLRMNNIKEFPREYVLDRWSKSDENVWVDTSAVACDTSSNAAIRAIRRIFEDTVDRLVPFKEKLDLYRLELSDLLAKAEADVPVLMRVNNKDTFCSMLGVTEPERVVIKVPRHSANKGTGSHKRWKNMDELIQNAAESSKKRRTCFVCGKAEGHNSRTCPHKDEINAANKRTKRVTRSSAVNYEE
ncbi:RNA-directed DNA polymerase, eukaryota [Tanacetum coccineum]